MEKSKNKKIKEVSREWEQLRKNKPLWMRESEDVVCMVGLVVEHASQQREEFDGKKKKSDAMEGEVRRMLSKVMIVDALRLGSLCRAGCAD